MSKILNEKIEIHKKLNPLIWQEDNSLLPEVKESLLNIVKEFKQYCDIPISIIDAIIVGSNASFNYTSYSDIDLHIIVNFDLFNSSKEVLIALFSAEKTSFNKEYNIKIHGIDVEVYVEDVNTSAVSNGIYSLYQDRWIKFPKKIDPIEDPRLEELTDKWSLYIEKNILPTNNIDKVNDSINTLYMIRKNSINVNGEFGIGNQLFKEIRNKGFLDKLKDKRMELLSKSLSLESLTENFLFEDSRNQLISKGKSGKNYKDQSKGKNRFQRRTKSRISASVREYNSIDMNKFFKDNILDVNIIVQGETDKYEVKISFGNILDTLSREIERSNTINPRIIIRALTSCFNSGNVYVHCSCLHPDTKIKLLDGTSPTVSELKNRFDSGETLYAYSVDEKGDFKPGKIEKVWITKTTSEFIKVTLDNNKEIITTPDHLYMFRDGTYKQAKDLIIGQSLMSLYFDEYQKGYDGIKLNSTGKYHKVVNIEYITIPDTPVYDIKVKDYPNFLVDAGVILHNCPDWRYRFDYYANINQITSATKTDDPLNRPSKITNPNDDLGSGCKHVLLVLSNTSWIIKVASVINNYIKYIQDHYEKEYAEIIYPALYNKEYTDPVQLSLFDDDTLQSGKEDIEKSNEEGRVRGQFKKGNTSGVRFAPKNTEDEDQLELELD